MGDEWLDGLPQKKLHKRKYLIETESGYISILGYKIIIRGNLIVADMTFRLFAKMI